MSDIDLAFELTDEGRRSWSRFVCEIEELPFTLLGVDLVDVERCATELAQEIRREGIPLYG